jgi:hypothetical protein
MDMAGDHFSHVGRMTKKIKHGGGAGGFMLWSGAQLN